MSLKNHRSPNSITVLVIMYIVFVLVRFLLALLTSAYPIVNIDEFLYYGMARSFASGEGLMFRGQTADYSYILYSLVLSPVYLLGLRGHMLYRAMQLWNILLISLSVFPLYGIAKECTGEVKKALRLTAVSMLLPDFMLGQLAMAENVIMPLFFLLIYLLLLYMRSRKTSLLIFAGVMGGLLFSAKPGSVIPAAVFFILYLFRCIFAHDRSGIFKAAAGLAAMLFTAACFFLLVKLLRGNSSLLSIYEVQVSNFGHLDVFFRFLAVYILYLAAGSGLGCFFLLRKKSGSLSETHRFMIKVILISIAVMILGVSWSVNRYEYNANTAHMRYIGMFIPLLLIFSMVPVNSIPVKKKNGNIPVYLTVFPALFTVLLIFPGIYAGINQYTVFPENMTFSVLIQSVRDQVPAFVPAVLLWCICMAFVYLFLKKDLQTAERDTVILLTAFFLVNNASAYRISRHDTRFDFAADSEALLENIPAETDPLYIFTVETTSAYYGAMDAYSDKGISFVKLNDVFNHMYASKGVYVPFVPDGLRGNIPDRETPDTDTILLDPTAYAMMGLSANTEHLTYNEDGLHLVRILNKQERWLDWVIGNTTNTILEAGDTGILLVFDENLLQSPMTFRFQAKVDSDVVFSIFSDRETKTLQLEAGLHEYEVTFQDPQNAYNFETLSSDLRFYRCDLEND